MTLNDLKDILGDRGFQKVGKKYVKNGEEYDIVLSMYIAPTISAHTMIIDLIRSRDSESMARLYLDGMFKEDRFYIEDALPLKDKKCEEYNKFRHKFQEEYIPTICKMTTNKGVAEIYDTHMNGTGLITWKLREELEKFDGVERK